MNNEKQMPFLVFLFWLGCAAIFDLASIIPFLGFLSSVFLIIARVSFWLFGYNAKNTAAMLAGALVVELIPGFSALPACIAFVSFFYLRNKTLAAAAKEQNMPAATDQTPSGGERGGQEYVG